MSDEEILDPQLFKRAVERLKRADELLREWRDRFGGQAVYKFSNYMMTGVATASPSDLLRDTNKFLEGK